MRLGAEIVGTSKAMLDCLMLPSVRMTPDTKDLWYKPARRAGNQWMGFRSI